MRELRAAVRTHISARQTKTTSGGPREPAQSGVARVPAIQSHCVTHGGDRCRYLAPSARGRAAMVRSHRLHLLAISAAIGLGPLGFARVAFHLKVFVALGPAEVEDLRHSKRDRSGRATSETVAGRRAPQRAERARDTLHVNCIPYYRYDKTACRGLGRRWRRTCSISRYACYLYTCESDLRHHRAAGATGHLRLTERVHDNV